MEREDLPGLGALEAAVKQSLDGVDFAPSVVERRHDPVTDLDRLVDDRLRTALGHLAPLPIVSEESAPALQASVGWAWVVDPIDGTHNLVAGTPEFGVSVALVHTTSWTAELAVCVLPARHLTYAAKRHGGAFENGSPMQHISPEVDRQLVALGYPEEAYSDVDRAVELPRALMRSGFVLRQSGSAMYDVCRVATGRLLGFVELGVRLWDVAAADLVARECGASSTWSPSLSPYAARDAIDYAVGATAGGLARITAAAGMAHA